MKMLPKRGDIISSDNHTMATLWHPVVYLYGDLDAEFFGVVLTKSDLWENNIPLPKHFIETHDEMGSLYQFQYRNTHFVKLRLIKPGKWGPYFKIGQLTAEGADFVESEITSLSATTWKDYKRSLQRHMSLTRDEHEQL